MPKNELKNYRPVSGLNFVAARMNDHISNHDLGNSFQSAYKKGHSTESAMLAIKNDILLAKDKGNVTALVLLDLSAAFDTIDHKILLQRLERWYGFTGNIIKWFSSYLSNRRQSVKVKGSLSHFKELIYGVPQGSVLGPLLFSMYTRPLSKVISSFAVAHKLYADDTQIYLSFSAKDRQSSINTLQAFLNAVQNWMFANKLKLNPDKTEFLLVGSEQQRQKHMDTFPDDLMGNKVNPAKSARNLGVNFDENFSFQQHSVNLCRNCYYHIRDLARIRKHLDTHVAKGLANALVGSRLDYCNSLFYVLGDKYITKLQRVQNCLARVVTKSPKLTESAPLLHKLHWLPIRSRIAYKINVTTFKALFSREPVYLANLISLRSYNRNLRANNTVTLTKGPLVKSHAGETCYANAAPHFWNQLPISVQGSLTLDEFRKKLKTTYFKFPPKYKRLDFVNRNRPPSFSAA